MTIRKQDQRALKRALLRAGVPAADRALAYQALYCCRKGGNCADQWQTLIGEKVAARAGFYVWDYIPLEVRRNWMEQPD